MYHILYFRDHLQNNLGCQITMLTGFKKILLEWLGIFELLLNVSWWRRQQFCHGVGDVAAHAPPPPTGQHAMVRVAPWCHTQNTARWSHLGCALLLCPIGVCDGRWPVM